MEMGCLDRTKRCCQDRLVGLYLLPWARSGLISSQALRWVKVRIIGFYTGSIEPGVAARQIESVTESYRVAL